jgi:hypothetical protein
MRLLLSRSDLDSRWAREGGIKRIGRQFANGIQVLGYLFCADLVHINFDLQSCLVEADAVHVVDSRELPY